MLHGYDSAFSTDCGKVTLMMIMEGLRLLKPTVYMFCDHRADKLAHLLGSGRKPRNGLSIALRCSDVADRKDVFIRGHTQVFVDDDAIGSIRPRVEPCRSVRSPYARSPYRTTAFHRLTVRQRYRI